MSESVIVVDFGGQYNQLIARRVRECHVYSEIVPYTKALDVIKAKRPRGIIFTGGPNSAYEDGAPAISTEVFDLGIPVLGICYGAQLMMHLLGGHVCKAPVREYGKTEVFVDPASKLFADISSSTVCWMSHTDYVTELPEGFRIIGKTPTCPAAAIECEAKGFYGVQFHPEVVHSEYGNKLLENFLYRVCGAKGDWTMGGFVAEQVALLKEKIGAGTLLNAAICGPTVDLLTYLDAVPLQHTFAGGLAVMLLGIVVQGFGRYIYMSAALCCGPRDALVVGIGKHFRRISIGKVNTAILAIVLAAGMLLGGQFGVGTIISAFGLGTVMQFIFSRFRFDPRSINNLSLRDYVNVFAGKYDNGR